MSWNIVIGNDAKSELKGIISFIKASSYQNAVIIRAEILKSFKDLLKSPERYPLDKFKLNNDGSFRAYELYHLRITYHISENQIEILRIRHIKRSPLEY